MTLVATGGTLIDGSGGDPVPGATVVVEGERFTAVSTEAPAKGNGAGTELDLDGLFVLPGLIDLHTHMGLVAHGEAFRQMPLAVLAAELFRNAELCLLSGHTTAREVAGADGGLARAIDAGLVTGPRLFPSGPIICQTGGHGDPGFPFLDHHHHYSGAPGLVQYGVTADGPDEVRLAARKAFRHGATQIKVCTSGGVLSFTDRLEDAQFSVEELRAAVEEARARDTYVTAHAHNVRGILNGLEAGLECFEHGTFLDEETAAKMASAGAALVPTLAVIHLAATDWQAMGIPEEVVPRFDGVFDAMAESVRIAVAAGVTVGSGSDILGAGQDRRGLEVVLRADIHDPMSAIVAATATNARILRRAHDLGTVEVGKLADLIAVDFDPLTEPSGFDQPHRVKVVVKGGEVVKDTRA